MTTKQFPSLAEGRVHLAAVTVGCRVHVPVLAPGDTLGIATQPSFHNTGVPGTSVQSS